MYVPIDLNDGVDFFSPDAETRAYLKKNPHILKKFRHITKMLRAIEVDGYMEKIDIDIPKDTYVTSIEVDYDSTKYFQRFKDRYIEDTDED